MRVIRLALVAAVVWTVAGAGLRGGAPRAMACTLGPDTFEMIARGAPLIALVDVADVGGAANEQPLMATFTPTATAAPAESPTPFATLTRSEQRTPSATPEDPTPTLSPTATSIPEDLTGYRAILDVRAVYAGEAGARITIDAEARAVYERGLRNREAGNFLSICGSFAPRGYYAASARYLLAAYVADGEHWTRMALRVQDGDVILGPAGGMTIETATYERYFAGLPIDAQTEDDYVTVRIDRIPLDRFVRGMLGVRVAVITPPETGNAGLR